MSITTKGDYTVIRPRRVVWMAAACALLLVAVFTVVAFLLRSSDTGVRFHTSDQVAMIGIGIFLGALSMLFAMPKVSANEYEIIIRNVLVTKRFAWNEVLSVSFPDGASWARLELPEDEYYPVLAVQAVDREHAVTAVRALRTLHKQAWQT